MKRLRFILSAALAPFILAACAGVQDWNNLPANLTGDTDQDAAIAVSSARYDIREAEALPLLQQAACGPFRVDIRTPRGAPGPNGPTPHLGVVINEPAGFDGRVKLTRRVAPFVGARIFYQTPEGWQDVTSPDTALALGASPIIEVEAVDMPIGADPVSRVQSVYLGHDPARNAYLIADGKYAMTNVWAIDPPALARTPGRLRPGNYRIRTAAEYALEWAGGACRFSLPDLPWRVPG